MHYFQFHIEDDKIDSNTRQKRLDRLRQLAVANNCSFDVEENVDYATVRVETPNEHDAMIFKASAEPALDEGVYQDPSKDKIYKY